VHPAAQDSDVSSNIWGDQQLQLVLADDIGLEGASKEPAASCDQGADGAGHEGESHEPGSKHIEAANALFTDEEWGVKKHGCCFILGRVHRIKPFNTKKSTLVIVFSGVLTLRILKLSRMP